MTLKTNPYYRLFMNTILLHCLVCFLRASFVEDSALVYICMLYIGVLIFGQYAIRQHIRNFAAYLLLHILLITPCSFFLLFSLLDVVIIGLFAIMLTIMSFKKSISNKTTPLDPHNTTSPFTTLLLPLFAIVGNYYELPIYSKFVFFEAAIYLILFIYYTFNVNEQQYIRDHCSTVNIPVKRILTTTSNIKYIFITVIIVVMFLVMGINIVIPKHSADYNYSENKHHISDTEFEYNDNYTDFPDLGKEINPPSAITVFLSYVFASLIVLTCVILLFIAVFSAFRTINPEKYSSTYFAEDEITVEVLPIKRPGKRRTPERAVTNKEKVRQLFKNATIKKMSPADNRTLRSVLNSKTPTEINKVFKEENAYSDEVIALYQKARYSNHEVSGNDVKTMKKLL